MMKFPTEWKVIQNSMVPLLIIISHDIPLKNHGSSHHQPDNLPSKNGNCGANPDTTLRSGTWESAPVAPYLAFLGW